MYWKPKEEEWSPFNQMTLEGYCKIMWTIAFEIITAWRFKAIAKTLWNYAVSAFVWVFDRGDLFQLLKIRRFLLILSIIGQLTSAWWYYSHRNSFVTTHLWSFGIGKPLFHSFWEEGFSQPVVLGWVLCFPPLYISVIYTKERGENSGIMWHKVVANVLLERGF